MVYSLVLDVTVRCKDHAPVQKEFILNYRRGNKDCITEMLQRETHLLSDDSDDSHQIDLPITIVTFGSFAEQNSEHDLDPEEFGEVLQADHRSVEVGRATVKMET